MIQSGRRNKVVSVVTGVIKVDVFVDALHVLVPSSRMFHVVLDGICYLDGEVMSYGYDRRGSLSSMSGMKNTVPYSYINSVHYDRFGNRRLRRTSEDGRGNHAQISSTRSTGACTTKHYYAGTERVCARIGNGGLNHGGGFIGNSAEIEASARNLFDSTLSQMQKRTLPPNNPNAIAAACGGVPMSMPLEPVPTKIQAKAMVSIDDFNSSMVQYSGTTQQGEDAYFYHGDHLGSASWITDAAGTPVQHFLFYCHAHAPLREPQEHGKRDGAATHGSPLRAPQELVPFGEPFVNQRTTGYSELVKKDGAATHISPLREPQALVPFTGKERDEETGFSYFGARYYDSDLSGLFLSVDPMADKYPSISPYAYCAWNPLKLVDPDGDTIKLSANSSDAFKEQFLDAIQYLSDNGAIDIFESLNNREETIYIEELSFEEAYKTQFVPSENKILWCPTAAMLTTEGSMLSPTISLNHEMDHCLERLEHPEIQSQNYKKSVSGYRNAEEQRVITGSEQRTALQLGEIKTGQITRQDHSGTLYETECSTSNAPKYPDQPIAKPLSNRLNTIRVKPK